MSIDNFNSPLDDNTFKEENCYNQKMDYSAFETKDGGTALLFEPFGYYRCLRQLYSLIVSAWEVSSQENSIFPNRISLDN